MLLTIFDADKIDRVGMSPFSDGVMTTVALPDVNIDFTTTVGGNLYRYGCNAKLYRWGGWTEAVELVE